MFEKQISHGTDLLAALPVAVYTTDIDGNITFYNDAAADLWGHRPELGSSRWCGSWRLYWPDGRSLAHGDCPMAVTLREGVAVRGVEAVAERPDGTRVPFMPYPTLLRDASGEVTGAINLLVDLGERKRSEIDSERLAAIVSSSDDAIISKTLDGQITSWNSGATRVFGYEPEEMIGQSILRLIPPELRYEEEEIISKLRRGERIEHFDTQRVAKDGSRVNVSLTVSPLRDRSGMIVGASKVARDITERKHNEDMQRLLFEELNHRVKNTLATIQSIASQSLQRSTNPEEFVASFNGRVQALARAHDILVRGKMKGAEVSQLLREQVVLGAPDGTRIAVAGPHVMLDVRGAVQLALVLHELATNARKYGALSVATGRLSVSWDLQAAAKRQLLLEWKESGVPDLRAPDSRGFGTTLIERSLEANGGEASIRYGADGLACSIRLPLPEVEDSGRKRFEPRKSDKPSPSPVNHSADLRGKRILLVEDEPLVAMDLEWQLSEAGCEIVGPAASVEMARQLVAEAAFDAALMDANLGGHPVDELAATLTSKQIPFAFASGYGREGLPLAFQDAPLISKPFDSDELFRTLGVLLADDRDAGRVVRLRGRKG